MEYRELAPAPALRGLIRCYWTLRAVSAGSGAPQRVLPDGCVEVIVNLGDRFERYHPDGVIEGQPMLLAVGPTTRALTIAPTGRIDLVGIRFAPGGAEPFLSVAPHELRDRAPAIDGVIPRIDRSLGDILAEHVGTEQMVLDRLLLERLRRNRGRRDPLLSGAIAAIGQQRGPWRADALTRLTGLSAGQLERKFRAHVGFGPKTFCRLVRFHRVVRTLEQGDSKIPPLAALAAHLGYADQAHMAREFREFAGTTVTQYRCELHPMSDYFHSTVAVPDRDA